MGPWSSSDGYRRQRSGKPLPAGGCLCEVRGDWAFFKQTFDFPAWNTKSGVCWQCCCRPEDIRDTSLQASWRAQRLSPEQFVARQRMAGARASPLFSCPGFTTACVKPDWLHTADQGVAADALGNIFLEVADEMAGPNREAKVKELWGMIRQWYARTNCPSRLDNLVVDMLQQRGKPPKLRCKSGSVQIPGPFCSGNLHEHVLAGDPTPTKRLELG